jgi:hypothetical protein
MPLKLLLCNPQNLLLPIRSLWSSSSSAAPSATPSSLQSQANPVTTHRKPSSSTSNPTRCKNPDSTHTLPKSTQNSTHTPQIHSEEESYRTKKQRTAFSFRNSLPISNLYKGRRRRRRRRIKHTRQNTTTTTIQRATRLYPRPPPKKTKTTTTTTTTIDLAACHSSCRCSL